MLCIMCDSPRNLADWAGFSDLQAGGAAAPAASTTMSSTQVYRTLVALVEALAANEALYRVFENGGIHIVTHLAR
jgi:hypothetical protein